MKFRELGLKVGLEIHVQLNSPRKLFCHCRPELRGEEPHFKVRRRLRVSLSELGEVDPAALWELRKQRTYIYEGYNDSTCLVELDEEPPHEPDEYSLETALAVAQMFNAKIPDEVYVMRKVVVDGSNTSGFQRTMLIGVDGRAKILGYEIGVESIALEEDACRKMDEDGERVTYRLDRLGVPLVEVSTAPLEYEPHEVAEIAALVGYSIKSTGRAKRGIGTVRQDLNVSIVGGAKVEIKGVPTLSLIPRVIELEVQRQLNLLRISGELRSRGVRPDDVTDDVMDVTDIFANTTSNLIRSAIGRGASVYALKLHGFSGILGFEVQPKRRFATEIADRVRVWSGLGGILHSDELPGYGISSDEVAAVRARLGSDAFILFLGEWDVVKEAVKVAVERLRIAIIGVPEETRAANTDGTTRFMRPRPGAARMYPETDLLPIRVTGDLLERARRIASETLEAKLSRLMGMGLSRELAFQLVKSPYLDTFEELASRYPNVPPTVIGTILTSTVKRVSKEAGEVPEGLVESLISALSGGLIVKESAEELLLAAAKSGKPIDVVAREMGLTRLSYEEAKSIVKDAVSAVGSDMGKVMSYVMRKYRGRIDASDVRRALEELLKGQ